MHMAKRLSLADVFQECLVMAQTRLVIVQRKLAPDEDLIRPFRKMHAIPRLQTDSWRKCVGVLHRDVLFGSIVDMRSPL